MEFFSNHLSFFLLITLLSSCQIHARDNQFFNKIPTTNNNGPIEKETKVVVTPNKDQEPNFMPENENAYGVYGHESGQLPNLIPNNKYLPKNYNPVAYVTVPQDNTDQTNSMNSEFTSSSSTYDDDNNNNNNNNQSYNSGSSDYHYYRGDNTYDNNDNNNNNEYYIGGNTYYHYYKSGSTYDNNDNNNNQYYSSIDTYNDQYHNGGRAGSKVMTTFIEPSLNGDGRGEYYYINNDQLQDMSEPRLMDKGYATNSYKNGGNNFYYNNQEQSPNTEKYVKNPYENSREFANSYIANNELSNYNNNNFMNYENEEEFQDEEHRP